MILHHFLVDTRKWWGNINTGRMLKSIRPANFSNIIPKNYNLEATILVVSANLVE